MEIFRQPAFGLNFADTSVEALALKKKLARAAIRSWNRINLPEGVIENGLIKKKEELIKALKTLLEEEGSQFGSYRTVNLALPESRVFTHVFHLPDSLRGSQILDALRYKAEGLIPYELEQLIFNYKVVETGVENEQKVFYAAAPKELLHSYQEVLSAVNLDIKVLDLESLALARSLIEPSGRESSLAILDLGARTTKLIIYHRGYIAFSQSYKIAGNQITEHLSQGMKIPSLEAEEVKKKTGLISYEEGQSAIALNIIETLKPLLGGIRRALDFLKRSEGITISQIILAGGTSLMPNLPNFLQANFDAAVNIGDPFIALKGDRRKLPQPAVLYATVVGSALLEIKPELTRTSINLLASR